MNGSAKRTRVDADELADLRAQLFAHLTTLLAADPEADGNPARSTCAAARLLCLLRAHLAAVGSPVLTGRGPATGRPATATLLETDPEADGAAAEPWPVLANQTVRPASHPD